MPKMMEGMDPEEMKKVQEEMGKNQDPKKLFANMFGTKDEDDE